MTMKFKGTKNYVATQDLMLSVNAGITLKRPLLVKGEPGTGKTMLAEEVAQALNMPDPDSVKQVKNCIATWQHLELTGI